MYRAVKRIRYCGGSGWTSRTGGPPRETREQAYKDVLLLAGPHSWLIELDPDPAQRPDRVERISEWSMPTSDGTTCSIFIIDDTTED